MKQPRVSIMASVTDERGLGKDNDLLVKIPEDFLRMKRLTMGHPIIMGRKTYESIGKPLPGRTNIIISRDLAYNAPGTIILNSLEHALQLAQEEEENKPNGEVFVFGGGQIFNDALPLVDRLYLTVIHKNFPADIFFPDYSSFSKIIEEEHHTLGDMAYTFLTLEK